MPTLIEIQEKLNDDIIEILNQYKNPTEPYHSDIYVAIVRIKKLFNDTNKEWITQKRKEHQPTCLHSHDYKVFDELLKELNQ